MARNTPSNMDDIIDSRDIISRIADLESERDDFMPDTEDGIPDDEDIDATTVASRAASWAEENEDDAAELKILLALAEEGESSSDWPHGETLIRDNYFETYAQELADDCGMLTGREKWPLNCIDWEKATRELQDDYTSIDYDGVTYWIRS